MRVEDRKAARLLVLDGRGRILLFRHSDPNGNAFWATPGGGVEPGETFEQAARRESVEELGTAPAALREAGVRDTTFLGSRTFAWADIDRFEIRADESLTGSLYNSEALWVVDKNGRAVQTYATIRFPFEGVQFARTPFPSSGVTPPSP